MAARYDIDCDQVATLKLDISLEALDKTPIPLTGIRVRMQISRERSQPALLTFDSALTSAITVDEAAGTFSIRIPTTATASFPVGEYQYDILLINEAVSPPDVDKMMEGEFHVLSTVTRLAA